MELWNVINGTAFDGGISKFGLFQVEKFVKTYLETLYLKFDPTQLQKN